MSFLADSARSELDTQAAIVAERVAVDYHEGAADFAFGKMPRYPKDPHYLKGWLDELQKRVHFEGDQAVYPEAKYSSPCTSDRNAIFTNIPITESTWKGWQDDF
jgi:hypothetical protein